MIMHVVVAYTVMACIVMACIVMAYIFMAYIFMAFMAVAYIVMAYIVMAYIVMAYIVMAFMVMAYIVMAYIVMGLGREAHHSQTTKRFPVCDHASMWRYYPPVPPLEQSRLVPLVPFAFTPPPGPGSPRRHGPLPRRPPPNWR